MSVSSEKLAAWRASGSLRYLAHELGISLKQAARYWDQGWIPGVLPRKRRGRHRRVRYTADTIARVAERVAAVKETNLAIRYHLKTITHQGVRISVEGCTSRESLYERALAAGLSAAEAKRVANRRRYRQRGDLLWEATLPSAGLLALHGLTLEAFAEDEALLRLLPIEHLLEAQSPEEFRVRALAAYRDLCAACATREARQRYFRETLRKRQWLFPGTLSPARRNSPQRVSNTTADRGRDNHSDSGPESSPDSDSDSDPNAESAGNWQQRIDRLIYPILSQRNLMDFAVAFDRAVATYTHRGPSEESPDDEAGATRLLQMPHLAVLLTILAQIREAQERPTVAAVARRLGASRKTIYRIYGKEMLRAMLGSIRYDRVSNIKMGDARLGATEENAWVGDK